MEEWRIDLFVEMYFPGVDLGVGKGWEVATPRWEKLKMMKMLSKFVSS